MSERMTSIHLPGMPMGAGLADWGRRKPAEMVSLLRSHAEKQKAEAQQILSAADNDFHVETYIGVHVRRMRKVLQEGRVTPECPYCGNTHGLRIASDGCGSIKPDYICEDCFTGTDTGPSFDDLPEVRT